MKIYNLTIFYFFIFFIFLSDFIYIFLLNLRIFILSFFDLNSICQPNKINIMYQENYDWRFLNLLKISIK